LRIWKVFSFLLTLYLLIKNRSHFLFLKPLPPQKLVDTVVLLGASFIKLAQVLATRSDFFSPEYLHALKGLHDELPPMSQQEMQEVFKRAFAHNPFIKFNDVAIASASIGQVHEAWIDEQTKVAVKMRRAGIERQVRADIRIIKAFNALFRPLFSHYTKHSVESVIVEFSSMILKEVSMRQELENLQKFSAVYADQPIRFPSALAEYCSDDVLVMSFEEGFRFDDVSAIKAHNIDIKPIIKTLVNFYTEQMLVRGFFHADPHPGNLLISPSGELILLDFGMLKRVPNDTRVAIIEMIKAANEREYERYISACKRLGVVAYEAPTAELAEFTERMFDIFNNDTLDSSSMQNLAFEVMDQTRNLPFKLPQEAIYILRVSAIIEGLGTTYIENFNGIKDILPILQDNIPRALGAKESILETLLDEFKALPMDIKAFRTMIHRASEGELAVELSSLQLESITKHFKEALSPIVLGFLMIISAIFVRVAEPSWEQASWVLFTLGVMRILFR
jgi:predicted unusual protein kinase regulating ubiquinone biosynthesis (AarF/ABC1/UbiB family)